jgi:diguanylate cyclase (GGDEF)-like protein
LASPQRVTPLPRCYPVTISVGVATTSGEASMTPPDLIRQADDKLYQTKDQGRNRVVA